MRTIKVTLLTCYVLVGRGLIRSTVYSCNRRFQYMVTGLISSALYTNSYFVRKYSIMSTCADMQLEQLVSLLASKSFTIVREFYVVARVTFMAVLIQLVTSPTKQLLHYHWEFHCIESSLQIESRVPGVSMYTHCNVRLRMIHKYRSEVPDLCCDLAVSGTYWHSYARSMSHWSISGIQSSQFARLLLEPEIWMVDTVENSGSLSVYGFRAVPAIVIVEVVVRGFRGIHLRLHKRLSAETASHGVFQKLYAVLLLPVSQSRCCCRWCPQLLSR